MMLLLRSQHLLALLSLMVFSRLLLMSVNEYPNFYSHQIHKVINFPQL